jgi:putative tryptophan/tyrosine transport system substrate-binding protein
MDVGVWLLKLGLEQYELVLRENSIDKSVCWLRAGPNEIDRRRRCMQTRRTIITTLALAAASKPLAAAGAQQTGRVWRIGSLDLVARPARSFFKTFVERLRELGYAEGRNLFIEWRSAEGHAERLPDLAADLVASNVDLIASANTQTTLATKQATKIIPIVAFGPADPVEIGLTKSLARPDGNITGLWIGQLSGKRLELLKEVLPRVSRVAVLFDPTNASHPVFWRETEAAAQLLGVQLYRVEVRAPEDIAAGFAEIGKIPVEALVVFTEPMIFNERRRIAELAAAIQLPVISMIRGHVEAGDLMAYGPNYFDLYRRAADYVDKIFKGATPADLPFEQPTRFELVINLKTAKALGITIPATLLTRADEVIE